MLFAPGSPQSSPHLISLVAPNSVVKHGGWARQRLAQLSKENDEEIEKSCREREESKGKGAAALPDDTITVQRLNTEVTGKVHEKYSSIGACLFVSYEFEEDTIENIKSACMKHFGIPEDGILCCNMLAGEQGPSYRGSYRGGVTKANPKPNAQAPLQVQAQQRERPTRRPTSGVEIIVSTSHPCGIQPEKLYSESTEIHPKEPPCRGHVKTSAGNHIKRNVTTAIT